MSEAATLSRMLSVELPLNNAFISYCAGISPNSEWEIGGIDGHKDKSKSLNFDCVDTFLNALKLGKHPARKHVVDFALKLFTDYWTGKDIIAENFSDSLFYFIIGPQRSGGTYLLTQMYQAIGLDYSSISRAVVRDSIPASKYLVRGQIQAREEIYAIFQLCQFLAWAREELQQPIIIQKNTCYVHWIPTLDRLFGKQAHYLVTARAPEACVASYIQLALGFPKWEDLISKMNEIGSKSANELVLTEESLRFSKLYSSTMTFKKDPNVMDLLFTNWQIHYDDIMNFRPRGEITVIEYGNPMLDFFSSRHPKYLDDNPKGLNWVPDTRDYASFIDTFNVDPEIVSYVAHSVYTNWQQCNMNFPNFSDLSEEINYV